MRLLTATIAVVALLLGPGCPPPPPEPPPPPSPDGGVPATCESMCAHWAELECDVAEPTPGGASCAEVCENVQDSGIIEWDLECRSRVVTCPAIDRCER